MEELISVHHKMSPTLHKKLKLISVEHGVAVTDITNQAIREWLERFENGTGRTFNAASIPEKVDLLRAAKASGSFFEAIPGVSKASLIAVGERLKVDVNKRQSRDRIAAAVFDGL
jgi:hypothetical protein